MAETPNTTCTDSGGCQQPAQLTFAHPTPTGPYVAPDLCKGTADYSTSECADSEALYHAALMAESLSMAAGPVNVFPLLGVHNQGSTVDQIGAGFPLSSGTPSGYNALDAFSVGDDGWRSVQQGAAVLTTPAYIGYDFGTKKAWEAIGPAQERYFPGEPVRKQIATLKIRQGSASVNRATQLRVEASDDGVQWKRIDILNIPNTDQLVTVGIKGNALYNKWRLVPIFFNGVASNSQWEVVEIQMLESTQMSLDTIEDLTLLENRDRAYCRSSVLIKCTYDLLDVQSELARFGINLPQTYIFTTSFADLVRALGRPVVVGDIVEMPGEVQYDANLRPVRKWLEVTDTSWATEGYTHNWKPNLFRFYAQPILPSVEHKDILGLPGVVNSQQTDADILASGELQNHLAADTSDLFQQLAADAVPQTGSDPQDIQSGMGIISVPGSYDGNDLYSEDAIPPNGAAYTSGDTLPLPTEISDGHYHRQTYENVPIHIRPADRLLRWYANLNGGRWKVVEKNSRMRPESHKKRVAKIMSGTTMAPDAEL